MALTIDELRQRTKHIGGSDAAAILGLNPWKSAYDVFLEKTNQVELEVHQSLAAEIGDRLEASLAQWGRDLIGPELDVVLNERFTHENGIFSAQVDAWLPDLGEPLEVKTAGLTNARWDSSDWGDEGTDMIPPQYICQVNLQMICTGAERAHVMAFLGQGIGPRLYTVPRNEGLVTAIHDRCERFWHEHVLKGIPPEGMPTLDVSKRRLREPEKITTIPEEVGTRLAQIKEQKKLVADAEKLAMQDVLGHLGDAEVGSWGWGEVTYRADKRGRRSLRVKERN